METILGIVGLFVFLFVVIKVCISTDKKDASVLKLLKDTIGIGNTREKNRQENVSIKEYDVSKDDLCNSPYYKKYQTTFDYIRYNGKQPKYKIDWLLKSLDMGRELEYNGVFVVQSIEKDYPYFCETEYEFYSLAKADSPALKGSIKGILDLGYLYLETNKQYFLQEKKDYWRNQLVEMARGGNLEAQAGLCKGFPLFTKEEVEEYKEKYQDELVRLAKNGNPYAQLGVGQFIAEYRSKESFDWLQKAGEQGLSDAYYHLAAVYNNMIHIDDDFQIRNTPLSEKEEKDINEKIAECYIKGAKHDNGILAVECQYTIASYYETGYAGFPKDLALAKYWYERALKNGKEYAASCIEAIEKYS